MAGTPVIGRGGELAVSTDGGTVFNAVGGMIKVSPNFEIAEVDVTTFDSAGFKEIILGDMSGEYTTDHVWEEDNAPQITLRTAYWSRLKYDYRLRPQTGSGKVQVSSKGWVTKWPIDIPENSKISQAGKVSLTSTITMSLQP